MPASDRRPYWSQYKRERREHYTQLEREYYHRIQDEAGCHVKPRVFYPAYRLIQALKTAEVVEI